MSAVLDGDDAPIMETVATKFHEDGEKVVIERAEDVEPLLDHLAELRATTDGKSQSGELYHVGDIPDTVLEDYLKTAGITLNQFFTEADTHIRRILMNPDFAKFRVWQGRI